MEPKSNFGEDLLKSEEDFAKQFDKNSATYHKGDPTPVPIGGDRIPESMPTIYQEKPKAEESKASEIKIKGPEYEANQKKLDELMAKRTFLGDVKKNLSEICPHIEAILRIKTKGLSKDKEDEQIQGELSKLKAQVELVNTQNEKLMETEYRDKYCDGINQICKDAFKEFKDKEDYTNYSFLVKRYTSMCFQDMGKILDEIKKVKKLLQ